MHDRIKAILVDDCGAPTDIANSTKLRVEAGLDSVGFALLVSIVEDEWGISVTDEEMLVRENLMTIDGIVAMVRRKLGETR